MVEHDNSYNNFDDKNLDLSGIDLDKEIQATGSFGGKSNIDKLPLINFSTKRYVKY